MKKENAILDWKNMIEKIIPLFDTHYHLQVFNDYVYNRTNYTMFHEPFYSIGEKFNDFESEVFYLSDQDFRKSKTYLIKIKEVSESYIENYKTIFYPELSFLIDNKIKESSVIVYNREEFLKTNRVRILFDYCEKVVELITTRILIISNENNNGSNENPLLVPDFKQLLNFAHVAEKEKFEDFILPEIKGKKGKAVAFIVCAMVELKLIHCTNRTEIYKSIRKSFECKIGTDSGINKFIDSNLKEGLFKVKDDYKAEYELTITKVQKFLDSEKIAKVV